MSRRVALPAVALVIAVAFAGCSGGPEAASPTESDGRVIVLGFDGLDPETVDELAAAGRLPNFAQLEREGAVGTLESMHPLLSPIVWTTIATGRRPSDHGVVNFVTTETEDGSELPVTSLQRRTKALWNIVGDAHRSVAVVGWWATWPAEEVLGAMVSDHTTYHFLLTEDTGQATTEPGLTHPPELIERIADEVQDPAALAAAELARFADLDGLERDDAAGFHDDETHLRWAVAAAHTYTDIGLRLWREDHPALLMVYVEGTDTLGHLFGHLFQRDDLRGELAAQQRRFGGAVEAMYELADEILGRYLAVLDEDTTLLVCSDHGFELGALHQDPSRTRDLRRVSHRSHRLHGFLGLAGRGIKAGASLRDAHILDLTPTVLALLGLAPAADMPGRILDEALVADHGSSMERVATYESEDNRHDDGTRSAAVDEALLDKLRSLGYLGGGESTNTDRNMAAILLQDGRYREAAEAYHQLLQKEPDDAGLRTFFGAALAGLGHHDRALGEIDRALALAPDFAPALHQRGLVLEALGRPDEAVAAWREAARYDPGFTAPRADLERVGAVVEPVAATADEQRAAVLLQRARELVARGDYDEALALVDEAQALAPASPVPYQYRANILYLGGDLAGAVLALEKGLAIAPGNAQMRANLRRLRARLETLGQG